VSYGSRIVSRPIVLVLITTVKTRAFVETVVCPENRPHSSRYEELLVVDFILLHRVSNYKCGFPSKTMTALVP